MNQMRSRVGAVPALQATGA